MNVPYEGLDEPEYHPQSSWERESPRPPKNGLPFELSVSDLQEILFKKIAQLAFRGGPGDYDEIVEIQSRLSKMEALTGPD